MPRSKPVYVTLPERTAAVAAMTIEGRGLTSTASALGLDRSEVRRLRFEAYQALCPAKLAIMRRRS
jgi:hypothetical protein